MRRMRRIGGTPRTAALALAAAVTTTLLAGPLAGIAQAHTELIGSVPKKSATVAQPPSSVILQFTEPVTDIGVTVQVTGPQGRADTGDAMRAGAAVAQQLKGGLPAGRYDVVWRVTSDDGHPVEGTYAFTATSGAAAGTSTVSPSALPTVTLPASAPATAVAAPTPTVDASPSSGGVSSTWFIVGATIVGAGLLAAGAAIALPRRRPSGADRREPPSD